VEWAYKYARDIDRVLPGFKPHASGHCKECAADMDNPQNKSTR